LTIVVDRLITMDDNSINSQIGWTSSRKMNQLSATMGRIAAGRSAVSDSIKKFNKSGKWLGNDMQLTAMMQQERTETNSTIVAGEQFHNDGQ